MEKGSSFHASAKSRYSRMTGPRPSPSSSSTSWRSRGSGREETQANIAESSNQSSSIGSGDCQDDLTSTHALIGTCPDMCPAKERSQRERLRDLSIFERLNGKPATTSPSLAVKKFCRTISTKDVQTSDIRPLAVLEKTLKYLLCIVDSSEHPFEVIHDFVSDRTRSIRQDLSMQRTVSDQIIHMYEEMVKFHVISQQKLARCCSKSDISSLCYLNMEQLTKCLISLFELYDIKQRAESVNKNKAEFYSLYVLLCLSCKTPITGDSLSLWFRQLPLQILQSKEMKFSRTILRYFRMGNYKCFFNTMAANASHLQLCLLEPLLNEVRVRALSYINQSGYKLHPYPLIHLGQVLMIKESELESLCRECGLEVITDVAGCKLLPTKQTGFNCPKGRLQSYSLLVPDKP